MADYILYDVRVSLLTPVHIGSGQDLLHEFDYAIHQRRTWRLNEDALLAERFEDDPAIVELLARTPPAQLLQPEDFRPDSSIFRYVLRGTPRSKGRGVQVREQIKDAYDRPYLPGTSLKGALRTALAWVAWEEQRLCPDRRKLGRSPKFAAQNYEKDLFGRNPNHDLLRALHVSDSEAVAIDRVMLVNAQVLHRSAKLAAPIELEALRPDTSFQLTLKVDTALFSAWARKRRLNLHGAEWLRQLPNVVQQHSAQRLETEVAWFSDVRNARSIANFYQQLTQVGLPENAFLLQFGWGTGWDDKTLGSRLRTDKDFIEGILSSHRQGGYGIARGKRQKGDAFPKSRRVLIKVVRNRRGQRVERPHSPLGWALVEMKER